MCNAGPPQHSLRPRAEPGHRSGCTGQDARYGTHVPLPHRPRATGTPVLNLQHPQGALLHLLRAGYYDRILGRQ